MCVYAQENSDNSLHLIQSREEEQKKPEVSREECDVDLCRNKLETIEIMESH